MENAAAMLDQRCPQDTMPADAVIPEMHNLLAPEVLAFFGSKHRHTYSHEHEVVLNKWQHLQIARRLVRATPQCTLKS